MLELRFNLIYAEKCVIALGFFDSVHRGHRHLIEKAKERAAENGEKLAVFTFDNNPFGYVGRDEGEVYTYSERIEMLKNMGVDIVVSATMDNEFSATPAVDFLDKLFSTMKISEVFCGSDYRYGKNGFGDVNLLNLVAKHYKVKVNVVDFLLDTADKKSALRRLSNIFPSATSRPQTGFWAKRTTLRELLKRTSAEEKPWAFRPPTSTSRPKKCASGTAFTPPPPWLTAKATKA